MGTDARARFRVISQAEIRLPPRRTASSLTVSGKNYPNLWLLVGL